MAGGPSQKARAYLEACDGQPMLQSKSMAGRTSLDFCAGPGGRSAESAKRLYTGAVNRSLIKANDLSDQTLLRVSSSGLDVLMNEPGEDAGPLDTIVHALSSSFSENGHQTFTNQVSSLGFRSSSY